MLSEPWRTEPAGENYIVPQPPLPKGEGDHEVVEGYIFSAIFGGMPAAALQEDNYIKHCRGRSLRPPDFYIINFTVLRIFLTLYYICKIGA